MMMKKKVALLALAFAGATMVGCTSTPKKDGADVSDRDGTGATTGGISMGDLDNPSSPLYKKVFYFEFDSSEIDPADKTNLGAHAKLLSQNPNVGVTVEGHCDERGTREYNLALGERRAKAVGNLLTLQGAGRNQVKVISFGEERPASDCHDESCWSKNRRAELKYPGR